MEGSGTVIMTGEVPTRPFVRKQVHVQNLPAATGAEHCRLLFEPILLHYIKRTLHKLYGQAFDDVSRPVGPIEPPDERLKQPPSALKKRPHDVAFSASSISRISGRVSPMPTERLKCEQTPSSESLINSILARLKVTAA